MIEIRTSPNGVKPRIIVAFKNNDHELQVSFRMLSINKTRFIDDQTNIFNYINQYWASLPLYQQAEIFEIYKNLNEIFDNIIPNVDVINSRVKPYINQLMNYHLLEHVRSFINKSNIQIPPLAATYSHSVDNQYTRERTYTLSDYMKLLPYALAIRCMIPIWHEYINLIKDQVGDSLKELFAYYLLEDTPHFECEAINKLEVYIDETSKKSIQEDAFVMKSLSIDDYPSYLLADLVIKKLCIGELSSSDPKQHIVSFCYKSLIQRVQPRPTSPEDTVRAKDSTSDGSSDESERSIWEQYRGSYDLSVGRIVEINHSVSDISRLARRLDNVPMELVESCIECSKQLLTFKPSQAQFVLLKLALAPVISPRCVMFVEEKNRYKLFGLAQAYLFHNNHKYLALLTSAYKAISGEHLILSDSDSRMGLRTDNINALIGLYPHLTPKTENQKDIKQRYRIFDSIDNLVTKIDEYKWRTTANEDMIIQVTGKTSNSVPIIGDIKNEIARLFIYLGSRKM